MTDISADFVRTIGRVRPIALLVLLVGVGASLATGMWAVGIGLVVSTLMLLGPMVGYLKRKVGARPGNSSTPTSGTMAILGILATLPPVIVGVVCVVASSRYWWVGFPAGVFLGIALVDMTFYAAAIGALRADRGGQAASAPPH